jgi:hypothetical protein
MDEPGSASCPVLGVWVGCADHSGTVSQSVSQPVSQSISITIKVIKHGTQQDDYYTECEHGTFITQKAIIHQEIL